jgi:hypothetical protein
MRVRCKSGFAVLSCQHVGSRRKRSTSARRQILMRSFFSTDSRFDEHSIGQYRKVRKGGEKKEGKKSLLLFDDASSSHLLQDVAAIASAASRKRGGNVEMRSVLHVELTNGSGFVFENIALVGQHLLLCRDGRALRNVGHDAGQGCVQRGVNGEGAQSIGRNDNELDRSVVIGSHYLNVQN